MVHDQFSSLFICVCCPTGRVTHSVLVKFRGSEGHIFC